MLGDYPQFGNDGRRERWTASTFSSSAAASTGRRSRATRRGAALDVLLVEKDDLASHTSSASSKLIHGGLRYLEQYRVRPGPRGAARARDPAAHRAAHRPPAAVRAARSARRRGRFWLIRAGLLLYDLLAGRGSLPRSRRVGRKDAELARAAQGPALSLATYWDAWVDDSRLVVAQRARRAERGAEIATRTELLSARREGDAWIAELSGGREVAAAADRQRRRALGRGRARGSASAREPKSRARLVKGSHILVPRLWQGDHAYILQQRPTAGSSSPCLMATHSLIGTTDIPVAAPRGSA